MISENQLRLIAAGNIISDEFGGVDASYMHGEGISLEWLEGSKYVLKATLRKVVEKDVADSIIAAWRGETEND